MYQEDNTLQRQPALAGLVAGSGLGAQTRSLDPLSECVLFDMGLMRRRKSSPFPPGVCVCMCEVNRD